MATNEGDVIILIIGVTGVGKSTFINAAAAKALTTVGHDLESCTTTVQPFIVQHPSAPTRRIAFVDTPGFNENNVDDWKILKQIADWLGNPRNQGMKFAGIIYLHDISQARIAPGKDNLDLFHKPSVVGNVILATTKWGDVNPAVGQLREKKLSELYWTRSAVARFENTTDSAWAIVDRILEKDTKDVRPIQDELVKLLGRPPQKTQTGMPRLFSLLFGGLRSLIFNCIGIGGRGRTS